MNNEIKIADIFGGVKLRLLQIFIEEEAKCYPKNLKKLPGWVDREPKLSGLGDVWVEKLKLKLAKKIQEKAPDGFNWCRVYSLGNAGGVEHIISIYGKKKWYNFQKPDIRVVFCTCGNLDCWGQVDIVKEKGERWDV